MDVLVAYASAHGSTRRVAEEIGARLARTGARVVVLPVDQVTLLEPFGAVVVGSAVHDMAWLPDAIAFVEQHAAALAARPTWLFSVSSVGDSSSFFGPRVAGLMRRLRSEPRTIGHLTSLVHPRGHRSFAGAVDRGDWNLTGHLFLRALGGRYGDHVDHADVAAWADGVAAALEVAAR